MASSYLRDCEEKLQYSYAELLAEFRETTGHDLIITCTYRSPEEQQALYAHGRTKPGPIVTQLDGVKKLSNHNHKPSRAIDVAVTVAGKVSWDEKLYQPLVALAEKHGLVSGGSWKTFKDFPHLELPSTH